MLEFFQAAPSIELQQMATCSKKKAEVIIESRPFSSWIDLVSPPSSPDYLELFEECSVSGAQAAGEQKFKHGFVEFRATSDSGEGQRAEVDEEV